jgi:type IV pilus assembly protein PilA
MFQRLRKSQEDREGGFTLIELLVVILIIAILAAIAIPFFLNQREKGYVAQQQASLKNAATSMETVATGSNGDYTGSPTGTIKPLDNAGVVLKAFGYRDTTGVTLTITKVTPSSYCLQASHANLTGAAKIMHYLVDDGQPTAGVCP